MSGNLSRKALVLLWRAGKPPKENSCYQSPEFIFMDRSFCLKFCFRTGLTYPCYDLWLSYNGRNISCAAAVYLQDDQNGNRPLFLQRKNVGYRDRLLWEGHEKSLSREMPNYESFSFVCIFEDLSGMPLSVDVKIKGEPTIATKQDKEAQTDVDIAKGGTVTTGMKALITKLEDLLHSEEDSDIKIKVGSLTYSGHKMILRARSSVFRAMLTHDMIEKSRGVIDIPDCDPEIFREFLLHLYSGKVDNISCENVFELYRLSDKYDVKELREECVNFSLNNLNVGIIGNVVSLALKYGESELLDRASDFFSDNVVEILTTVKWQEFIQANPIAANELFLKSMKRVQEKECNKH